MKNVKELRDELVSIFEDVKCDRLDLEKAKVLVSASNSMIRGAGLELEHSKFTSNKNTIEFLNTDK